MKELKVYGGLIYQICIVVVFNLFQNFICTPAPFDQYQGSDICKLIMAIMKIAIVCLMRATVTYGRRILKDIKSYEKLLGMYGIYIQEFNHN